MDNLQRKRRVGIHFFTEGRKQKGGLVVIVVRFWNNVAVEFKGQWKNHW